MFPRCSNARGQSCGPCWASRERQRGERDFRRACRVGNLVSCARLVLLLTSGRGVADLLLGCVWRARAAAPALFGVRAGFRRSALSRGRCTASKLAREGAERACDAAKLEVRAVVTSCRVHCGRARGAQSKGWHHRCNLASSMQEACCRPTTKKKKIPAPVFIFFLSKKQNV